MFIIREYAACLIVVLVAATLLFAGCGIFLVLKAGYRIAARTLVPPHELTTATLGRTREELPIREIGPAMPLPGGMQ